jgi:hypothetical protein
MANVGMVVTPRRLGSGCQPCKVSTHFFLKFQATFLTPLSHCFFLSFLSSANLYLSANFGLFFANIRQ